MSHSGSSKSLGDVAGKETKAYDFAKKKPGKEGRPVPIWANFFPVKVNCDTIYHYNIDIQLHDFIRERDDKNVPQRNRLVQQKRIYSEDLVNVFQRLTKQETTLFSSEPIYDGTLSEPGRPRFIRQLINFLSSSSVLICFQVRRISTQRLRSTSKIEQRSK